MKLEFFYDFSSPYSYLASTQVEDLAKYYPVEIVWRPFLLGGVFNAIGSGNNMRVPAKGRNMIQDVQDWARYYGISVKWPSIFPLNSVKALRGCYVAEKERKQIPYSQACFKAYWVDDKDLNQEPVLREVAAQIGLDPNVLLEQIQSQEIKDRLRADTDEVIQRGGFGAPLFFIKDKMFWGQDRLPLIEEFLKKEAQP
ncbi:MAG: 2-hydroxychromene-2-carboxylate isomerase [Deltaproteobacteria bacterium]|nr:2-hydroxychromene-2-carboxylate isomerase [Deltaproteobacteria bacterium]